MIYEILAGVVLSLAYFIGALIYFGTKDECVPFVKKHRDLYDGLSSIFYVIVLGTAILAGILIVTRYKEATIGLLLIPIIQMSICSVGRKHKEILKIALISMGLFLVGFALTYFIASYFG